MSPFDHTDASLASSAPFLAVAEPAFLLLPFALWALARPIGNAHTLHSHRLRSCFVSAGIERGIRRHQPRNAPELILMSCDGRDQQLGIMGPPGVDFIFGDDLVLRFLQLHHLAELVGLASFALKDDLGRWLEHADNLSFDAGIAAKETLRLTDNPARRIEQAAIALLQAVTIERALRARYSHDLDYPQLHTATAVAQLGSDFADNTCDLLHGARQDTHAISQQRAVGRIMDVALHHGRVHAHPRAGNDPVVLRYLDHPLMDLPEHLGSHCHTPPPHGLGVRHLATADTRKVAVDQVGAHLSFQSTVAQIADVLENQQT